MGTIRKTIRSTIWETIKIAGKKKGRKKYQTVPRKSLLWGMKGDGPGIDL